MREIEKLVWNVNTPLCLNLFSLLLGAEFTVPRSNTAHFSVPIYISTLDCGIDDTAIINCSRINPLGLTLCTHLDDVYVQCEGMLNVIFTCSTWCVS